MGAQWLCGIDLSPTFGKCKVKIWAKPSNFLKSYFLIFFFFSNSTSNFSLLIFIPYMVSVGGCSICIGECMWLRQMPTPTLSNLTDIGFGVLINIRKIRRKRRILLWLYTYSMTIQLLNCV